MSNTSFYEINSVLFPLE